MKVGDRLRCTYSKEEDFTVGDLYVIDSFDIHGDPILVDNDGYTGSIGVIMDGNLWKFEPVNEEEQTQALVKILEMSQKDFEEGRVMTREQLMESLNKD